MYFSQNYILQSSALCVVVNLLPLCFLDFFCFSIFSVSLYFSEIFIYFSFDSFCLRCACFRFVRFLSFSLLSLSLHSSLLFSSLFVSSLFDLLLLFHHLISSCSDGKSYGSMAVLIVTVDRPIPELFKKKTETISKPTLGSSFRHIQAYS